MAKNSGGFGLNLFGLFSGTKDKSEKCDSNYKCMSCNLTFETNSALWLHYLTDVSKFEEDSSNADEKRTIVLCPLCNDICISHIKSNINGKSSVEPRKLQIKPISISRIKQHLKEEHGLLPCDNCHEVFYTDVALQHHFKLHAQPHKQDAHYIKCPKCDVNVPDDITYQQHYDTHRSLCLYCNEYFADDNTRNRHILLTHLRTINCTICKTNFNTQVEFKYHYADFHRVSCNLCKNTFPDKNALAKHQDANHWHKCNICKEIFNSEKELKSHFAMEHEWKCLFCKDVYESEGTRFRHIQAMHRFPCTACEKVMDTEEAKDEHIALVHERKCDICERIDIEATDLELEQPMECPPNVM